MSSVETKTALNLNVEITMTLPESEARMLLEMTGYGVDKFLEGYYKMLGKSYMKPHEPAVRTFFSSIRQQLPQHIRRIDNIRKVISKIDTGVL